MTRDPLTYDLTPRLLYEESLNVQERPLATGQNHRDSEQHDLPVNGSTGMNTKNFFILKHC